MKKVSLLFVSLFLLTALLFSQEGSATKAQSFGQDLIQGLEAYKVGNWEDAVIFLKRTSNFQEASSDVVWYFVVMAESNLGDYQAALRDGTMFLEKFNRSIYAPEITYQTLYASYELGMYEQAISGFTAFIKNYPEHDLVAPAVFFTGEALYNVYEFASAKAYYDRIIVDFPNSSKYDDALFRLELLKQREREEKLLYLLRVTGEEAVAAKEDYERQIKQLQSEEALILRKRLEDLEQEFSKLQVEKEDLIIQNENLKNTVQELQTVNATTAESLESLTTEIQDSRSNDALINDLTEKALELQKLIND